MLLGGGGGAGNQQIALGVRFYLKDQFSKPVKQMSDALKGYKGEFQAFQDNLRAARNTAMAVAGAGAMATAGMYSAAMEGAEFLYVMKGVEAITEATNVQMEQLQTLALGLGRETMFMPEDIASGMRFMAMAGQDAQTIMQTMEAATNLGGATMTTLGGKMGAADIMTNALKAFGWEAKRSTEMSDILVAATTSANVSLLDLGNSIRYVSATSRNLQIPVQETIGLLMSLGNAGIQSSMAGTALENMYRYLARSLTANASKKAREAWESMGLSKGDVTTATGRFKPMVEILGMMNKAMAGMDPIEVQAIFRNIFGVRGVRGAATIARNLEQAGQFVGMLSDEKQIGGTASRKMGIMMDNLQGASLQLVSTWKGLKVAFAGAVGKQLVPLMHVLKGILGYITDFIKTPVGGFLSSFVMGVTAVTTVVFGLKAAILGVAYSIKTLNVSWAGMAAASNIATGFMGLGGLKTATQLASGTALMASTTRPFPYKPRAPMGTGYTPTGAVMGGSHRYKGQFATGTRIVGISPRQFATPLGAATSTLKKATPLLGRLTGVLSGFGAFLGPIGIGVAILAPFLPMIINAFSSNTDAVNKNTEALTSKDKATSPEIMALIQGKRIEDILGTLSTNIMLERTQNSMTFDAIIALLEKSNMEDLIRMFMEPGGITTETDAYDRLNRP